MALYQIALRVCDTLCHTVLFGIAEESIDLLVWVRKSRHKTAVGFRIAHTLPLLVVLYFSQAVTYLSSKQWSIMAGVFTWYVYVKHKSDVWAYVYPDTMHMQFNLFHRSKKFG